MLTEPDPRFSHRCAAVHGMGLARVSSLAALLDPIGLERPWHSREADAVLAWGRKPSAQRAQAWALKRGLPVLWLEDGFLRSLGLGHESAPLSVVLDDLGVHYDATCPSRLEALIQRSLGDAQIARALDLMARWRAARVSKYNSAREQPGALQAGEVLVVDQTAGDASIACGLASPASFDRMLEAALDENPGRPVVLKVHPDVVAGRKKGHFGELTPAQRSRVRVLADRSHPVALLQAASAVYVVSSQMGFEALLWGKPVRCFGMPFYAGWGQTQDELPAPTRRRPVSLEALVHACLVDYPRYLDPETGQACSVERLVDWMGLQRRERERFAPRLTALGFSLWKRPLVRRFLAGSDVDFIRAGAAPSVPAGDAPLVLWGQRPVPATSLGQGPEQPVIRLEDGFLRSVGLGADLVRPLSWVADGRGLYYDASGPSDLEHLLATTEFSAQLKARAHALRERILALGLTKYNVGTPGWQRPNTDQAVVLVVGQVESDAAIARGAPGIRTNLGLLQAVRRARPTAYLLYKPHPDVVARLRQSGQGELEAQAWCDAWVPGVAMHDLLRQVDEVHVLTSLAGFEALLRNKPVVTWGCPFYAGWGLTTDQHALPRRTRPLDLDELTAGVLILYPRYVSRVTQAFTTPERALDELEAWRAEVQARGGPRWWERGLRLLLRLAAAARRR